MEDHAGTSAQLRQTLLETECDSGGVNGFTPDF